VSKLSPIATLLVCLSVGALAQGPPALDTFDSPDGTFQFVYPETYELLVGERILGATQGRATILPVCDFSTALACVIYPIESERETRLEAAGFSVDTLPLNTESDCLAFADQAAQSRDSQLLLKPVSINSRLFRHASSLKKLAGDMQSADFYRIFMRQKCYELRVEVAISDDPAPPKVSPSNSFADPKANTARESLRLILSSVVFGKE